MYSMNANGACHFRPRDYLNVNYVNIFFKRKSRSDYIDGYKQIPNKTELIHETSLPLSVTD